MEVEASLHELVKYIFVDNIKDNKVYVNIPFGEDGIRDNHDFFVFCVDLLCKGLVLLYGDGDNKVPLESLTQEQMAYVTKKLLNAGILLKVDVNEIVTPDNLPPINFKPCIFKGDTDELESYKLRIVSKNSEYTIRFSLTRI